VRQTSNNKNPLTGLELTRQLAMLGFRTADELKARFTGPAICKQQRIHLPVENYLQARAEDWAKNTTAAEFICLSQSCDLLNIQAEQISIPVWLAAAANDAIVPFEDVQQLAQQLPFLQCLTELDSQVGHDAFLVETEQVSQLVSQFVTATHNDHDVLDVQPSVTPKAQNDTGFLL